MIISPLTPRSSACVSRAARPRQSITMPSRSSRASTSLPKLMCRRLLRCAHAIPAARAAARHGLHRDRTGPRENGLPATARARVMPRASSLTMAGGERAKRSKSLRSRGMRHHQRAVERRVRKMLAPEIERADAEPRDHGLRGFRLAPRRQHAAGPMAGGMRHRGVAALVQGHGMAGLREQQRLPCAGNACAYDGDGGFPPLAWYVCYIPVPSPA